MDDGDESIEDQQAIKQIQRQAHKVTALSLVFAVVLTLIIVLLPV